MLAALLLVLWMITGAVAADHVVVLTSESFEKLVGKDRGALVKFCTPSAACKKLEPEYHKVGSAFRKVKTVLVGKVSCDEHPAMCQHFKISNYPSFNWYPKGSLTAKVYNGPPTAEALIKFVNAQAKH